MPARAWPVLTRMHARATLVDDRTFIGSVGWTARSVFQTEEVSVVREESSVTDDFERWFEGLWAVASRDPAAWPLALDGFEDVAMKLESSGITTVGDLVNEKSLSLPLPDLDAWQLAASWVAQHRFAPRVAILLGRAGVRSLAKWNGANDVASIAQTLQASCPPELEGVPAATYVARRIRGKEV